MLERAPSQAADRRVDGSLPALTGLRGVAVGLVLLVHAASALQSDPHFARGRGFLRATSGVWGIGGTGVDLFFVLSGFLLFTPYALSIVDDRPWPSPSRFWRNRARRVVPAYWIALLILLTFGSTVGAAETGTWRSRALHFIFLQNWTSADSHQIDTVFWTMAIEVQFYICLPLVAAWLRRLSPSRLVPALLGATAVVTPTAELVNHFVVTRHAAYADHLSLIGLWEFGSVFAAGMTVAALRANRLAGNARWGPAVVWLAWTGSVLLALRFVLEALKVGFPEGAVTYNTLMAIGYGALVLGVIEVWPRAATSMSARWLVLLGVISYSVYIWHFPLFNAVAIPIVNRTGFGVPAMLTLTILVVLPISWASYRLTERPFYKTKA
jgi:peptidoglycan/LPS O-acetylase OafA/YrhL